MTKHERLQLPWYLRLLGVVKKRTVMPAIEQLFELRSRSQTYTVIPLVQTDTTLWLCFQIRRELHYPDSHLLYDGTGERVNWSARFATWTMAQLSTVAK